jgi:glycosyltransferase involved in cell wall biosynthesis
VNPIKNFNRLLLAYLNLPELTRPDLVAVIPEHNQKINIPGLYIISEKLEQYELAKWYRGALAFILPSLRETFGLTIVEAMSCGTPVITSNVTGCAEISGNAAYLINPRSVNDITKAMSKFINNNFLCEKLRLKGLDQVEQFSWKISAIKLVNIFRYVTQKRISIVKN